MITEAEVENSCEFLRTNAKHLAKAKAERCYLEEFRKSKKAILIQQATQGTAQSKEAFAYSHPEYLIVLQGLKKAVETEERLRWLMVESQTRIEIWRSQESTNRAIDKSHR